MTKTNYKFYKDHKFMVVDDDDRLRTQAIGVLCDIGFSKAAITPAVDGKDALKKLDQQIDIEFFVIDLVMPNMNGLELLNELKTNPKYEKYKNIPKLVLSSESDANIILNAVESGANSYLNKPCEAYMLAKKLFECVSK